MTWGDGTTTATVLASYCKEGLKNVAAGTNQWI
jgi:chaperonin GroEL (HSP60 family)